MAPQVFLAARPKTRSPPEFQSAAPAIYREPASNRRPFVVLLCIFTMELINVHHHMTFSLPSRLHFHHFTSLPATRPVFTDGHNNAHAIVGPSRGQVPDSASHLRVSPRKYATPPPQSHGTAGDVIYMFRHRLIASLKRPIIHFYTNAYTHRQTPITTGQRCSTANYYRFPTVH